MPRIRPPSRLEAFTDIRLLRRFLTKVVENPKTGCWEWVGHRDRKGYGQIKYNRRAHWAHRVAFALFRGTIPGGITVDHLCRNRCCVNPHHLSLADLKTHGRESRARQTKGEPQCSEAW